MKLLVLLATAAFASAWLVNPDPRAGCPSGHARCSEDLTNPPNDDQWKYGPDALQWAGLCPAYAQCDSCHQSPVDIPASSNKWAANTIGVSYAHTNINFVRVDDLVTLPVTGAAGNPDPSSANTIHFNGREYNLQQIEFKHPAEHTIDGHCADFEMQLYHRSDDGHWVAVAVLFNADECDNDALEKLWCYLPGVTCCECGNGILEMAPWIAPEECDRGFEVNNATRDGACRPGSCAKPFCGDGILDESLGEECDNGSENSDEAGACKTDCKLPYCGDGFVDTDEGEECDYGNQIEQSQAGTAADGNGAGLPPCTALCRWQCGNNRTDTWLEEHPTQIAVPVDFAELPREECDDGENNSNSGDDAGACRTYMHTIPLINGSAYFGGCRLPFCGDGIVDASLGEECDDGEVSHPRFGQVVAGFCRPGCVRPYCGDGEVDASVDENGDHRFNSTSIDGVEWGNFPEECEINDDAALCNHTTCRWHCGDGITDPGEECDAGPNGSICNDISDMPCCLPTCVFAECGDGIVHPGEDCDDLVDPSNTDAPCDAASGSCFRGSYNCWGRDHLVNGTGDTPEDVGIDICTWRCGNHQVNKDDRLGFPGAPPDDAISVADEACDNGRTIVGPSGVEISLPGGSLTPDDDNSDENPNACRTNCQFYFCGDGLTDRLETGSFPDHLGELCDDGRDNADVANAPCRTNCMPRCCGDGLTDSSVGEQCDDGADNNSEDNAGCSSDCMFLCGDGVRGAGEDCDDGPLNSEATADKCRTNSIRGMCVEHFCGDGVLDSDEECDPADPAAIGCSADCHLPYCGDGFVQSALREECDEGDMNSNSMVGGCSSICTMNMCSQNVPRGLADDATFDLRHFVRNDMSLDPITFGPAYVYSGSWPHPPCTEGVDWIVLEEQQKIGVSQLMAWGSKVGRNARPVQPHCERTIGWLSRDSLPMTPMPMCGNGVVEAGEQCDDGHLNSNGIANRCRDNCMAAHCGDGVTDAGEDCDRADGSCSADCWWVHKMYMHNDTCQYWNYDNEGTWNTMGKGCESCAGDRQSPIMLPEACPKSTRPMSLNHPSNMDYTETPVVLFNTGRQMLWPVMNGGTFSYHGNTYLLEHIEFHEPSEHYIGEKRFDFEVQLHHKAQNPGVHQNAVLAVLFEKSVEANMFFEKFWNQLPVTDDCRCGNGIKEDVYVWSDGRITKEECDNGDMNSDTVANACRSDCTMPRCGDGVVDANEACDWGMGNSDTEKNACRTDCTVPSCGDGITDDMFGEWCDDGNCEDRDGCDKHCRVECGNGIIDGAGEVCDDGPMNSDTAANACRSNCQPSSCGDGVVDVEEECDMGSMNADDMPNACRSNCMKPMCGDGVVDAMEECDGGDGCTADCRLMCGDGVTDAGEECDNGAANSDMVPNACRKDCTMARCGDGVRDMFEECDDGGDVNNPHCSSECKVVCGNGILECEDGIEEECDHGVLNSADVPNACRPNCRLPWCGDGVTDQGASCFEECDLGSINLDWNSNAPTQRIDVPGVCVNCRKGYCGDGVVSGWEECDDGNHNDGDGCSAGCKFECGNGRVDPGEECDDGEKNNMYGACRQTMDAATGLYMCHRSMCGDGIVDPGEECDDGAMNKDGPNSCRMNCMLPQCGDGIVDHLYGERCDMGMENSETTVDGCSPRCTPNVCGQSVNMDINVSPHDLIPSAPGVYCYDGSVNAPPCTENTQWFVFSSPMNIGECQLEYFKRILSNNARPAQCLNGRTVSWLEETAVCGDGLVEGHEECDDGHNNSDVAPNACRRNCMKAKCGDGVQDAGEQCDGTPNCNAGCRLSCPAGVDCPNCNADHAETEGGSGSGSTINVNFAGMSA